MSDWKAAYRSFFYEKADSPVDPVMPMSKADLRVVDVQNTYMKVLENAAEARRGSPFPHSHE